MKSEKTADVNIFWNNNQKLNYIEVTPGEELNLSLQEKKNLYFNLYVREVDTYQSGDRGKITFYFRTNVQIEVFMTKSEELELVTPSKKNFLWKANTASVGGMTAIEIQTDDPNYCVDCEYIAKVASKESGQLRIQVEIEHANQFLDITVSSPLSCYLSSKEQKKYRVWNPDADLLDFTV